MPKHDDPERQPTEELLTTQEVGKRLRVGNSTVLRWIRDGSLPGIPLPHKGKRREYRVRKVVVDELTIPKKLGQ